MGTTHCAKPSRIHFVHRRGRAGVYDLSFIARNSFRRAVPDRVVDIPLLRSSCGTGVLHGGAGAFRASHAPAESDTLERCPAEIFWCGHQASFVDGRTAAYLREFRLLLGLGLRRSMPRSVAEFLFGPWEFDFDIHGLIRNSPLMLELLARQLTVDDGPPRSEVPAPACDARPCATYRELQSRVRHDCMGSTFHARSGRMRNGAYGRGSLRAMKRHNVYDNSAVFVISDHGGGFSREESGASGNDPAFQRALGTASAVLASKPPHARGGMAFSDRPMTLTEFPALVCSLADCRVESAFPPQDPNSRRFLSYDWRNGLWTRDVLTSAQAFEIAPDVARPESWRLMSTGDVMQSRLRPSDASHSGNWVLAGGG